MVQFSPIFCLFLMPTDDNLDIVKLVSCGDFLLDA